MRKRTQSREYALQVLYQKEMRQDAVEEVLLSFWQEHANTPPEVKEFTERIVRGTVEKLSELDDIIVRCSDNWQLDRMSAIDRNILRFGAYELLYLEDIPPKVSINEAVNIAKKYSQEEAGKFVNGVLDKINHSEKSSKTL
ncbi:MAG: transcription antitermination factor NusB [Candidatus Omnitrophica bacterium]|nr:transcription antitermination factor NusB [Candidatus Omnitrophota bacterium]